MLRKQVAPDQFQSSDGQQFDVRPGDVVQNPMQIESILRRGCKQNSKVHIFVPSENLAFPADLVTLSVNGLYIRPPEEMCHLLPPQSMVAAVFHVANLSCTFLTIVRAQQTEAATKSKLVSISIPENLATVQARSSFRVPLPADSGLKVMLSYEDLVWVPTATNISLGGVLVEFKTAQNPRPPTDCLLKTVLSFEGKSIQVFSTVRWCVGNRLGLLFEDSFKTGDLNPPKELGALVRELERRWLENITL